MSGEDKELRRIWLTSIFYRDKEKPSVIAAGVAAAWELLTSGKVNERDHPSLFRSLIDTITGADQGEGN